METALWLIVLAVLVLVPLLVLVRMGWRILRDEERMEPGGSLGRQFLGRHRRP